jgi:hypothetical protein
MNEVQRFVSVLFPSVFFLVFVLLLLHLYFVFKLLLWLLLLLLEIGIGRLSQGRRSQTERLGSLSSHARIRMDPRQGHSA